MRPYQPARPAASRSRLPAVITPAPPLPARVMDTEGVGIWVSLGGWGGGERRGSLYSCWLKFTDLDQAGWGNAVGGITTDW